MKKKKNQPHEIEDRNFFTKNNRNKTFFQCTQYYVTNIIAKSAPLSGGNIFSALINQCILYELLIVEKHEMYCPEGDIYAAWPVTCASRDSRP